MSGKKHIRMGRSLIAFCGTTLAWLAPAGCNGFDVSAFLNLRAAPVIIPQGASPDSFRWAFSVNLRNHPDAASVAWDFGDGATASARPIAGGRNIAHDFPSAGLFNVQVFLFDGGDLLQGTAPSLIGTGTLPVRVLGPNAAPTATFSIVDLRDDSNVVVPNGKRFNGATSRDPDGSIVQYEWDFGDGETGQGMTLDHTFATGGRFTVRLKIIDDRGATGENSRNLLVNTAPEAAFDFTISTVDNLTTTFDAQASSDPDGQIARFSWSFGDNQMATGSQVQHTYAAAGTFTVTLTVTDSLGTTTTTTRSVHVAGTDLLVNSITPEFGVVNTRVGALLIRGENFQSAGLALTLERGPTIIQPTSVNVVNSSELSATFDLTNATLGDYDVVVLVAGSAPRRLTAGFRVGTANRVRIESTLGDVVIELVPDAPLTTANFLQYVTDRFYDGTLFHRVAPTFVVQGGGFLPGMIQQTGTRPPVLNEFSPNRSNIRGTLAMAKLGSDPNSATSEFFFNLGDNSANLDNQNGGFTVFANVITGLDVVDAMGAVPLIDGESPVTDIVMTRVRRE